MGYWDRIDRAAIEEACRRAASQPRMDEQINWLQPVAALQGTDAFPIVRNNVTYQALISQIPTGGGSTSSDFFNVKNYGAKGDGVTDDTAAIQTAIAAASSGGIIFFPPGQYLVSASLTIPVNGVSFLGSGSGASKIVSATSASVAPTVLSFNSGVGYCFVEGLAFIGNSTVPSGPPPNAPTVIVFTNAVKVGVYNCYFTGNTGDCIDFLGCTDGEVASCRFYGTGYRGAGDSNALQTPAVYSNLSSSVIRVHHNYLENCQYLGIQHLGTDCEASYNEIKAAGACGIRLHDGSTGRVSGARVIGNVIYLTAKFSSGTGSGGGTGIYADATDNFVVANNIIHNTDADGMSFAGCNNGDVSGNVVYNCCQAAGDCGIQFNPQSGNPGGNVGMTFIGNTSYDNQVTPTQQNGMRILGPGSGGAFGAAIVGNSFYGFTRTVGGNPQNSIAMTDSILDDDSNVLRSNGGGQWEDYQHLGGAVTVNAGVTASAVNTPVGSVAFSTTIQAGEMGLQRGFHFVAFGRTTGTDTFQTILSYGSSLGNIFSDSARTSVNNAFFKLEVWIFGGGANNSQHFFAQLTYNGSIVATQSGSLSVTSGADQPFALQFTTTGATTVVTQSVDLIRV